MTVAARATDVHLELDRPRDGLLAGRAEMISGWVAPAGDDFAPAASCGGRPVLVGSCFHPVMLERPDARGFWGYVFPQQLLDTVQEGRLAIELLSGGRRLGVLSLRATPAAHLLATEYSIDLSSYEVPPPPAGTGLPEAVVFPGLGGVGGASLNETLRVQMLRDGRGVTVHYEADHPDLWRRVRARDRRRYGWIDGHACHAACDELNGARVTMLREPARRLLSVFDYGTLVHPGAFPFASFDEFLASPAARRTTQAVSLLRLAGVAGADLLPDAELAARAATELAGRYALVGVTERFEESLLLIAQLAGLREIGLWWRVLAAPRSVALEDLAPRTRDRLESLVAVDRMLHDAAAARLSARIAQADLGDALQRYRAAAARERVLPDVLKELECLRWRLLLDDAARDALHA